MLVKTKLGGLHDNNTKFNKCLKNFKHVYDNNMFITCHGLENLSSNEVSSSRKTLRILTKSPCSKKDASYSISITLPGHPNDDAACHNAK